MADRVANPRPGMQETTLSNLTGRGTKTRSARVYGMLDNWLFKYEILEYCFNSCARFSQLSEEDRTVIQRVLSDVAAYRHHRGGRSLFPEAVLTGSPVPKAPPPSWQGALSEAGRLYFQMLENIVYGERRETEISNSCTNGHSVAEFFSEEERNIDVMTEIDDLLSAAKAAATKRQSQDAAETVPQQVEVEPSSLAASRITQTPPNEISLLLLFIT